MKNIKIGIYCLKILSNCEDVESAGQLLAVSADTLQRIANECERVHDLHSPRKLTREQPLRSLPHNTFLAQQRPEALT